MQAHLPLNSGSGITSIVKSVEFLDGPGGVADVGLILDEECPEARSLLMQACTPAKSSSLRDNSHVRLSDVNDNER
jgi:hypothetical protein